MQHWLADVGFQALDLVEQRCVVDCARKSVKGMHTDPGWQSIPRLLLES
jgi:hypothetical protein